MKLILTVDGITEAYSGKNTSAVLRKVLKKYPVKLKFDLSECYGDNLKDLNFSGTDLSESIFGYSSFENCCFVGCDFKNCNLREATFYPCDFENATNITAFGPVGGARRIGYVVNHDNCQMVKLGCFWGTLKEAVEEIRYKYGMKSSYEAYLKAAAKSLKEQKY
jgi:hypothetical protein